MAVTNALNRVVVQTEIDAIFVQEYENADIGIGYATAETPDLFKQITTDNAAYIDATLKGAGGFWKLKGEEQPVAQVSPRFDQKATYTNKTWADSIQISKEFFDDNMHNAYEEMVRLFARNARETRDLNAFEIYRDAFTGTVYQTPDATPWIAPNHSTAAGLLSNEVAGNPQLSPASLDEAVKMLAVQKSEDGVAMNVKPNALVVAPKNLRTARQIAEAELVSNTATNAPEFFISIYGFKVMTSAYLDSSFGGFGNNDNGWILLGKNHGATRFIREGITTDLIDYKISNNDNYVYKGRFRETYGIRNYCQAVGSDGSNIA